MSPQSKLWEFATPKQVGGIMMRPSRAIHGRMVEMQEPRHAPFDQAKTWKEWLDFVCRELRCHSPKHGHAKLY